MNKFRTLVLVSVLTCLLFLWFSHEWEIQGLEKEIKIHVAQIDSLKSVVVNLHEIQDIMNLKMKCFQIKPDEPTDNQGD